MPQRTTHRALTVVGLILSLALSAFEGTVVATAMPTVIGELGGIHFYAWVANAYLLASSVTVPIYGKLADIYGRKPIVLFGIAVFLLGSAASGAAQNMTQLIAFRAVQGLGAGAMQPMAITIVGDIFDLRERSRMQGIFGAAWGFFGLTGPMLGGLIIQHLSWRWVFYINLPLGIAAAALLLTSLFESIEKRQHKLDFAGAGLLTLAVVSLLMVTGGGGSRTFTLATAIATVVFLAAFVAVERVAEEPVIPLPLFARPVMLLSSVTGAIIGGAMMAILSYVPLFVQGVLHGSPTQAGSAITPMVIGWPIASAIGGRLLPSVGFRPIVRLGIGITLVAAIALALFGTHDSLLQLGLTSAAFGVGMGFANTALIIAVQTSVRWNERGIATASTMFVRTIGGAIAVAVVGGVITAALRSDPTIPEDAVSQLLSREGLRSIDPGVMARLGGLLQGAFGTAFWIIAGITGAAFLASLAFPHVPTTTDDPKGADKSIGEPAQLPEPPPGH